MNIADGRFLGSRCSPLMRLLFCFVLLSVGSANAAVKIVKLLDDPVRSRMYALQQDGVLSGAVQVLDPFTNQVTATIPVGRKPTDFSISSDGGELLVICAADRSITVVNLAALTVTGTINLTGKYDDYDVNVTHAHIRHGTGNLIYYTDGAWAPMLRVYNRSTATVVQSVLIQGIGFGDFAFNADKSAMYAWKQYGWHAGSLISGVARYPVNGDGTLADPFVASLGAGFTRDPLDTPVFVSANGNRVFMKQDEFDSSLALPPVHSFPSPVYSISPQGEIAVTATGIFETATGNRIYALPQSSTVQAITSDYGRLVYYDEGAHVFRSVDLFATIGTGVLQQNPTPRPGAVVLPPNELRWSAQAGASRYQIYLGTSPASFEYLGETTGSSIALGRSLIPGTTYYWHVDAVMGGNVSVGQTLTFTVATIASSLGKIETETVAGHAFQSVDLELNTAVSGKSWSLKASVPWISFSSLSGVTPATIRLTLDASVAPVGLNTATVTVTGNDGSFVLPVSFRVAPLALTMIRNDSNSTKVYAISEESAASFSGFSRAYLLEIDTLFGRIDRVTRVGTGVTDIAIHEGDGRVYVTNWKVGSLLAVDCTTFQLTRSYSFEPFEAIGSGTDDVYRISAGGPGRLVVEAMDQWIYIAVFETNAGVVLSTSFQFQGGGTFDADHRYYYHGDSDTTGAGLHKLDTSDSRFPDTKTVEIRGVNFYGSRTVLMSENGERIFWNGLVYDKNLTLQWNNGTLIYSTSWDGRYAFGETQIFDVDAFMAIGALPVSTTVSGFNSATGRLVYQSGSSLGFFRLPRASFLSRPATFDAQAYLDRYPDVAALAGSGTDRFEFAWQHYYYVGVLAGRTDGEFDPAAYLSQYADLRALYGTNLQAAALHWYNIGRFEGRRIPAGFDVAGYLARYSDIAARFSTDLYGAWLYYRDHGIYNGEVYDELFRVEQYLALYPELYTIFGTTDLRGALLHWLNEGRIEGRLGRIPLEFDVAGYFARNPDVAAAVGGNLILGWQHFWNYGIYEGRAYDDEFRVFEYLAINPDLQAVFLNDWRGATLHWMRYGRMEGRLGRVPVIFNVATYLAHYPEVGASWGTASTTVWQHFWLYGIDEARVFDEEFRVDEYLALNPDLHALFGTNRRAAFVHWVRYGRAEGRPGRNP